ncbi:hypothetical protein D9M68_650660 [compost metagenome]
MKPVLLLIRVLIALILLTHGVNKLSEPSNTEVAIGIAEIVLGLALLFNPLRNVFKKL